MKVNDIKPVIAKIDRTEKYLSDGIETYNQTGKTYNESGETYGGVYGTDGPKPK